MLGNLNSTLALQTELAYSAEPGNQLNASKQHGNFKEAAENFEAFFVHQMMEMMFKGVKTDGVFRGGQAEKVFRSVMFEEMSKEISQSGQLGIADSIMRQMIQMQEELDQQNVQGV